MPSLSGMNSLGTERLILRRQRVDDASVFRELWAERDRRVPAHRRLDAAGRPSVEDIAARIREERDHSGPRLLAVQRIDDGELIGYCGLTPHGNGSPEEPELAYELLASAQGRGYATEAGRAVVAWADEAGYRRLWAGVWDWNTASRRVLHKLGFNEVGATGSHSEHGRSLLTMRNRGGLSADEEPVAR